MTARKGLKISLQYPQLKTMDRKSSKGKNKSIATTKKSKLEIKLPEKVFCYCDCGGIPKKGNRYIFNHRWRNRKHSQETIMKMSRSASTTAQRITSGYIRIFKPNYNHADNGGYVLEHRLV